MVSRYTLLFAALLTSPLMIVGQTAITEYNNSFVRARILGGGRIGGNPNGSSNYNIPAGLDLSPLFSSGLWLGGTTSTGQQRCAAHLYGTSQDYSTGPLTADGNATLLPGTADDYDRFWTITGSQVEEHAAYFECLADPDCDASISFPDHTIPNVFYQWPAMGDLTAGQDIYLAPFSDPNSDGYYDPQDGDHPCVPGDLAVFHIFNDQGQGQTGGPPMGLEVHMTIFGYYGAGSIGLARTLFTRYRIINRSSETYSDFRIGIFGDLDLGCYSDDRIGTDVGRNLLYIHNASDNDVSCQTPGYGEQPPAFGMQVLKGPLMDPDGTDNTDTPLIPAFNGSGFDDGSIDNERHGLSSTMYYNGDGVPGTGDPENSAQFDNYLQGSWADGVPLTHGGSGYGGAVVAAFAFPGNTDPDGVGTGGIPQGAWTDDTATDRKGIAIMGPVTLEPGAEQEILVAYIYARATDGGAMGSVTALQEVSDEITAFAEITPGLLAPGLPCTTIGTRVDELNGGTEALQVHPNPATHQVTIHAPHTSDRTIVTFLDAKGMTVLEARSAGPLARFDIRGLQSGMYTIRMVNDLGVRVARFVKE